jgi:hypothetical protein
VYRKLGLKTVVDDLKSQRDSDAPTVVAKRGSEPPAEAGLAFQEILETEQEAAAES